LYSTHIHKQRLIYSAVGGHQEGRLDILSQPSNVAEPTQSAARLPGFRAALVTDPIAPFPFQKKPPILKVQNILYVIAGDESQRAPDR
jgi:hypothetical protein